MKEMEEDGNDNAHINTLKERERGGKEKMKEWREKEVRRKIREERMTRKCNIS